jgi:hypothetical protein
MENNMRYVRTSADLHDAAASLAHRCLDTCSALLGTSIGGEARSRGGRKGHELDVRAQIKPR